MPNFALWLASDADRAQDTWARISERPTTIHILRDKLAPITVTVRIEYSEAEREKKGQDDTSFSNYRDVILFGVRNHPTQPDTDILRGDRFAYTNRIFRVDDIIFIYGGIQAKAVAIS